MEQDRSGIGGKYSVIGDLFNYAVATVTDQQPSQGYWIVMLLLWRMRKPDSRYCNKQDHVLNQKLKSGEIREQSSRI
jgi:hypothetical protein